MGEKILNKLVNVFDYIDDHIDFWWWGIGIIHYMMFMDKPVLIFFVLFGCLHKLRNAVQAGIQSLADDQTKINNAIANDLAVLEHVVKAHNELIKSLNKMCDDSSTIDTEKSGE